MLEDAKKPVYDKRVKEVIKQLSTGKSREKLAEEMGYTTYKSIDMHMRRKNFRWDSLKQNYVPVETLHVKLDNDFVPITSKAYTVISLFEEGKPSSDPKSIAKLAGFKDHYEMANYMKGKNYRWSTEKQNYIPFASEIKTIGQENPHAAAETEYVDEKPQETVPDIIPKKDLSALEKYLPILDLLEKNKSRLMEMFFSEGDAGAIPRYIIPGVFITKSVHMSNTLDRLVREFSNEKNMSQREIFEVALINFFRQYGYKNEIDALLNKM